MKWLLLGAALALGGLLALGEDDLAVAEDGDLHEGGELAVALAELVDLVGVGEEGGAAAQVEGVVAGPHVHRVLPLRPARRHHQLPVAVHPRVLVELRMHPALLPTLPPPPLPLLLFVFK